MLPKEIRQKWKPRKKTAHKGDFGKILIVAGSRDYSGAAFLSGVAALKAGGGLVTLAVPKAIHAIVARRQPELIVKAFPSTASGSFSLRGLKSLIKLAASQDVIALGPGLSQNVETQKLILKFLGKVSKPLILDADGLNALSGKISLLKKLKQEVLLTPHPGEFVRLFGGVLSPRESVRKKRTKEAARKSGCFILLKGHHTVIASPQGKIFVNSTGNPGMAKAGSGDVLTGILAALLGQKFSFWDAARFGAYWHGLAGDLAIQKIEPVSLLAGDLLDYLPRALRKILSK